MQQSKVFFIYPIGKGDSGQRRATELIVETIPLEKEEYRVLPVPLLRRGGGLLADFKALIKYLVSLAVSWVRIVFSLRSNVLLHWSIGQTRQSWIRDAVPIFLGRILYADMRIICSINGSNFLAWEKGDREGRIFSKLLNWSKAVTVLGPQQREKLISLGVDEMKLIVLPNTCEFAGISEAALEEKLSSKGDQPIRILYLSSLIDTKGYPVFLESLERLGVSDCSSAIQAKLCGQLTGSQFSDRFSTLFEAEKWIHETIAKTNEREGIEVEWIQGAWGDDKAALYAEADIFVLPTTYRVEAQPLVILEAMAHGCAIITSKVGEIPSTLSDQEAILLDEVTVDSTSEALLTLMEDRHRRTDLARAAWQRYQSQFTPRIYGQKWRALMKRVMSDSDGCAKYEH